MYTQLEQVNTAKSAYLIPVDQTYRRWAIYLLYGNPTLEVLWPSDCHLPKSKELLPYQVFTKRESFPAYHFVIETGSSYPEELATMLAGINPRISCFVLSGKSPHHIKADLSARNIFEKWKNSFATKTKGGNTIQTVYPKE